MAFREHPLKYIDLNENVREFKTITTNSEPEEDEVQPNENEETNYYQWLCY